jgi:hypothetical protein
LAQEIDNGNAIADKKLMDFLQNLMQTILESTLHPENFLHYKKGTWKDNAIQFISAPDYFMQEALESAQEADLFELSDNSNKQHFEI